MAGRIAVLAVVIAAAVTGCATPPPPPPPPDADSIVVAIANSTDNRVEVLGAVSDPAQLAARPNSSFTDSEASSIIQAVWGPDDRIYVTDLGNENIRVYEADDVLGSADPTPVAILTSGDVQEPYALAFDDDGNLWIADRRNSRQGNLIPNRITRHSVWAGATGSVNTPADVILNFDNTGTFTTSWITDIFVDDQGDLWFSDTLSWSVSRLSGAGAINVDTFDIVPDLRLQSVDAGNADLSDIRNPTSFVLDADGNLYVGNAGRDKVARFDDAVSLAGDYAYDARQADATLAVGLLNTAMVGLAPDGALWVASRGPAQFAQVVRVTGQAGGSGEVALTPTKQFNWSTNTHAYHEAGGLLFHTR
ncbi:MAG TPA: hypothetical protein VFN03_11620 [Trueperaceae bacterium]|nr:hypothetical protein [Trueperaceae bacterium]